MNVLLIDVDSKIPNLALMKIAQYYRQNGDNVGFNVSDPDKIYASAQYDDAVARCRLLKEHDTTAYVMCNIDVPQSDRMKQLKRWCRPWLFWSIDIEQYGVR